MNPKPLGCHGRSRRPLGGYIMLPRDEFDNESVFQAQREKMCRKAAWVCLVQATCWSGTQIRCNGRDVALKRGQICASIQDLADMWGWSRGKAQRFISDLCSEGYIETNSDTGKLIITICGYDRFQGKTGISDTYFDTNSRQAASGLRANCDTQNKNEYKEERKEEGGDAPAYLTPVAGVDPDAITANLHSLPPAPEDAPARIIRAFDDALAAAFGEAKRRNCPHPSDRPCAERWLQAGEANGLSVSQVIAWCIDLFRYTHERRAASGEDEPKCLKFYEKAIARMLDLRQRPMPKAHEAAPVVRPAIASRRPLTGSALLAERERRRAFGSGPTIDLTATEVMP